MKQHHTIEVFSANCPLCKHVIDTLEIGKCEGCNMTIYDVNNMTDETKLKMKNYGIRAVPTTIVDGSMKVEGIPDFPWICGDDLYRKLRKEYSLNRE
jgi:glutaredoxin